MEFLGDGTRTAFLSLSYDGNYFFENGYVNYIGSDEIEDEAYMDILSELDIQASWDELFSGRKAIRDYVENVKMIANMKTVYAVDYETFDRWQAGDSADKLQLSHIYFHGQ